MNFSALFLFSAVSSVSFAVTSTANSGLVYQNSQRRNGLSVYEKHVISAVRAEKNSDHKDYYTSEDEFTQAVTLKNLSQETVIGAAYLAAQKVISRYAVSDATLTLNPTSVLVDPVDQIVSFKVLKNKILVEDAFVTVHFKNGILRKTFDQSLLTADFQKITDRKSATKFPGVTALGLTYRVVQTSSGFKGILVDNFLSSDANAQHIQVEAVSGEVFEIDQQQMTFGGTLNAAVYQTNYLASAVTVPLPFVQVSSGTFSDELGRYSLPESGKYTALSIDGLIGKFVSLTNKGGDNVKASSDGQSNADITFDYSIDEKASNKQQAQVMSYYHLNKIINYARDFITNPWLDSRLTARVNIPSSAMKCNAFWERLSGSINLIEHTNGTCSNAGLVADIMYHEWGHGLHQNSGGINDKALSEGFGDTLAFLITKNPKLAESFLVSRAYIRNAEELVTYPPENTEPHHAGLVFSGSMWELYKSLRKQHGEDAGQKVFAKLSFKMIYLAKTMKDSYEAVQSIDATGVDVKGPNYCLINAAFATRKLTDKDSDCK